MEAQTTRAATGGDAVSAARVVVDHGLLACQAYQRPDLAARLDLARRKLADPGIHVVVVGEFKQGKSSLVNALVGVSACPVDDDVATAVPTYVRFGEQVSSAVLVPGDPPSRVPIEADQIRHHSLEGGQFLDDGRPVAGVEVSLPRSMLSGGLTIVDTPGLGGLGSAHAAASLAATAMADAVLFVTDASQELTRTEVDFLRRARDLCPTIAVVLTKTDFYPAWRTIRDLDRQHLRDLDSKESTGTKAGENPAKDGENRTKGGAADDIPLIAVSSTLRSMAVKGSDSELNTESGFRDLVKFVVDDVGRGGFDKIAKEAAQEVVAVCDQLSGLFRSEQQALADPASAKRVVDELTATKERVTDLRQAAARWNQTLSDGVADLNADVDHDFRSRVRGVIADADEAIENGDPADTWDQMEPWLSAQVSYELVANYTFLRDRAADLSVLVGEHFRQAAGETIGLPAVHDPIPLMENSEIQADVKLEKSTARKTTMTALRGSYSGILMFTMLPHMLGFTILAPIAIPLGLLLGRSTLKDEKNRQLAQRRAQAKNAVRKYCDEIQFVMGKDSRDTLRRIQRQLRDHYAARAEELNRTTTEALQSANEAAKRTQSGREGRLKDLAAELNRLAQLRTRALAVG